MDGLQKKLRELLVQAAETIVTRAKARLEDGPLKTSLRTDTSNGSIKVIMLKYGIFQDRGVSGTNSSDFKGKKKTVHKSLDGYQFKSKAIGGIKLIDKWMYRKGIQGRDEKGRFIKRASTNFMIRRSIAQHGIQPSLFLTTPYLQLKNEIQKEFNNLSQEITKDIGKHGSK